MERCATCRHWERNSPQEAWELIEEPGEPPQFPFLSEAHGTCALTRTRNGRQTIAGTLAIATDTEQYAARLLTHETYGCVQHQTGG